MNLKRLSDSLQYRDGKLYYRSMNGDIAGNNKESKLDRTGIFGFGVNRNKISVRGKSLDVLPSGEPIADRVYSLLQVEGVEGFGDEKKVQKFLKEQFETFDKGSLNDLFRDLQWQFDEVIAQATTFIEDLYKNSKEISVRLHSIESSSKLVSWFINKLMEEDIYEVGGKDYVMTYGGHDFKKSTNVYFDTEAYVSDIVASDGDEEEALKEAEEISEDLKNDLNEDGTITLHKSSFSNKKRMALRKYIHFLDTDENFKRGMVDIFIDDFVTSGATIEAAMHKMGERDGSTFGVAMFRVK